MQFLAKIIEHRIAEILRETKFEIEKHISINQLSFGVVITGDDSLISVRFVTGATPPPVHPCNKIKINR